MGFIMRNETFICENCGYHVSLHPGGSARNHCPKCLASKHVDDQMPGDRESTCYGIMQPIGMDYRKGKGDVIRQKCNTCGKEMVNIVAPDDEIIAFVRKLNAGRVVS
ncbi:RNHCP domain-containing protein [Candidatus Gracilibacteria bacterium]|nr:RNHCP domain-containing protein [Candidatus Gracilibacteria bacterium]